MAIITMNSSPSTIAESGGRRRRRRISFTKSKRASNTTKSASPHRDQDELDMSHRSFAHVAISILGPPEEGIDGSDHTARTVDILDDSNSREAPHELHDAAVEAAKKSVRFGTVEVREYPRALGDNPSVSFGPPLGLEWEHVSSSSMDLNDYEFSRFPFRREQREMVVPFFMRTEWLRDAGYSRGELNDAARAVIEIKAQRRKSAGQNKASQKAEEFRESFGRFKRRSSKQKSPSA